MLLTPLPNGWSATNAGPPHVPPSSSAASSESPIALAESASWTNASTGPAPNESRCYTLNYLVASSRPAIAYDPTEAEAILFDCRGQTWAWSGLSWQNLTGLVGPSPPPRAAAGMVYAPSFGEVLLFGGEGSTGRFLNDTWAFASGRWSNISSTLGAAPPPRAFFGWTYDALEGSAILFGGEGKGVQFGDTWELVASGWRELMPTTFPSSRLSASLSYDPTNHRVILFGGYSYLGPPYCLNDTWTYIQGNWTNVTGQSRLMPGPRQMAFQEFDPGANATILFGGCQAQTNPRAPCLPVNDTWRFAAGNWTDESSMVVGSPPATSGGAMTYDAVTGDLVLFGGLGPGAWMILNATWIFHATPMLAAVNTSPTSWSGPVGGTQVFSAIVSCLVLGDSAPCGGGTSLQWSLNNSLGTLNATRFVKAAFSAGSKPGMSLLFLSASEGGTNLSSTSSITIYAPGPVLSSVAVYPSSASVSTVGSQTFTATPTCSPSPCPSSRLVYTWMLNNSLGSASPLNAASTSFTAGSAPGLVTLTVNVSLNGEGKAASTSIIITSEEVSKKAPPGFLGLPGSERVIVLGAAVGLVAAVAALLVRRRKSPPTTSPASSSPTEGEGPPWARRFKRTLPNLGGAEGEGAPTDGRRPRPEGGPGFETGPTGALPREALARGWAERA